MPSRNGLVVSPTHRMRPQRVMRLVYKKKASVGRPSKGAKEKQIDEVIRGVFLDFDFSPVFSGDSLRARLVASDIYYEIMARSKIEAEFEESLFTEQDVRDRWASVIDKQVVSLLAFKRHFVGLLPRIGKRQD
jgi:hypothetical protein